MIKRKPALIITTEGIIDQSTYLAAGLIKWEEIADIDLVQFSNQTFLGIYTLDPDLIINRSNSLKSMMNRMNKGLLATQVNIPIKILDCSVEELIEMVSKRWKEANLPEVQ
nr:STM3941 family protein [Ornithinibacillus scapharcae]